MKRNRDSDDDDDDWDEKRKFFVTKDGGVIGTHHCPQQAFLQYVEEKKQRKFAAAISSLRMACFLQDPHSLYEMGKITHEGLYGVYRNWKLATCFFFESATKGHPGAIVAYSNAVIQQQPSDALYWLQKGISSKSKFVLAHCYLHGHVVQQSDTNAFRCFEEDEDFESFFESKRSLAFLYLYGRGCEKSEEKSLSLFTSLALKGDYVSQFWLAEIYRKNIETSIPKSLSQSYHWFKESSFQGFSAATKNLWLPIFSGFERSEMARNAIFCVLMCWKKRSTIFGTLNKDIVMLLAKQLWESRKDQIWIN